MNKKFVIPIVLIFVLAIWGKLAFDFIKYLSSDPVVYEYNDTQENESASLEIKDFEYDLKMDYVDPFLKKNKRKAVQSARKPSRLKNKEPIVEERKQEITWPDVEFLGDITNSKGTQACVILKVNGEESMLHEGGLNNEVSLITITKDSLVVSYMDELKTLIK